MAKLISLGFLLNYLALKSPGSGLPFYMTAWSLILGLIAIAGTVYISCKYYIPVPFEDEWSIIQELGENHGVYTVPLLWAQHNEHRSPFEKLLVTADLYWFKGRNISLYLELYVIQILHGTALIWFLRRNARWPPWLITVVAGMTAFALFWVSQYQSFINPVQVCYLSAFLFATLSIFAMAIALEEPHRLSPWLALSAAAAFLSEANLANGLAVWPLTLLMALRFRLRPRYLVTIAGIAVASIALYAFDYRSPEGYPSPIDSFSKPRVVMDYMFIYLGSVWAKLNFSLRGIIAFAGMITVTVFFFRALVARGTRLLSFTMLTLCMFLLATAFLTALGRIHISLDQAASSRYQSAALLFWLFLAIYFFDLIHRRRERELRFAVLGALVLTSLMLPSFPDSVMGAQETADRVNSGALPIFSDVKDPREMTENLIVSPETVFQERTFLKSLSTSFYGDPRYPLLGHRFSEKFLTDLPNRCQGALDRARPVSSSDFPGWELTGWAWDSVKHRPVESIVSVRAGTVISGFGVSGLPVLGGIDKINEATTELLGWRAYVQGGSATPAVSIYGIVDNGRMACLVSSPRPLL